MVTQFVVMVTALVMKRYENCPDDCNAPGECDDGQVLDCDGSDECCPESWIGDGLLIVKIKHMAVI